MQKSTVQQFSCHFEQQVLLLGGGAGGGNVVVVVVSVEPAGGRSRLRLLLLFLLLLLLLKAGDVVQHQHGIVLNGMKIKTHASTKRKLRQMQYRKKEKLGEIKLLQPAGTGG